MRQIDINRITKSLLVAAMAFDSARTIINQEGKPQNNIQGKAVNNEQFTNTHTASGVPSLTKNYQNPEANEPAEPIENGEISLEMLRLQGKIAYIADSYSGIQGVYIHEIGKDPTDSAKYNENQMLLGASTMDIPLVITTMKILEGNNLDYKTFKPSNSDVTVEQMINDIILLHNNDYVHELYTMINEMGYNVNIESKKFGIEDIDMDNMTISAKSLALVLEKLSTNTLGLKNNEYILSLLSRYSAINDKYFPWAVNDNLNSIGKFDNVVGSLYQIDIEVPNIGHIVSISNDAGILTTKDGRKFVICIIGNYQYGYNEDEENKFIPEISNLLIDSLLKK